MVQTQIQPSGQKRKARSPSYPAVDLETAIDRARTLYTKEFKHYAPVGAAAEHWGYSRKSSGGILTVAALKKYGLLEEQGSGENRQVRVSPLALKIILDERPDSAARFAAIREAALNPTIHEELWNEYGGKLPSDSNLRYKLRAEMGFTDSAANELIEEFRRTVAFARLADVGTMSGTEEDIPPPGERAGVSGSQGGRDMPPAPNPQTVDRQPPPPPPTDPLTRSVQIPLLSSTWATLQVPYPMSEADWEHMLFLIKAMKPGLAPTPTPTSAPPAPPPTPAEIQQKPSESEGGLPLFTRDRPLTDEAEALLRTANNGGVPAFMTENLARIARENGITVTENTTPNQILDEFRERV